MVRARERDEKCHMGQAAVLATGEDATYTNCTNHVEAACFSPSSGVGSELNRWIGKRGPWRKW